MDLRTVCPLDGLGIRAEFCHGSAEGAEVIDHRLINEDVPVSQEENALLALGLPQAPDDLKGRIRFAGASGHDEQNAVLPLGNRFNGGVDGIALVIARRFAAAIVEVILEDDLLLVRGQSLPDPVSLPQLSRRRELIQ